VQSSCWLRKCTALLLFYEQTIMSLSAEESALLIEAKRLIKEKEPSNECMMLVVCNRDSCSVRVGKSVVKLELIPTGGDAVQYGTFEERKAKFMKSLTAALDSIGAEQKPEQKQ
jgi:hypothetical protein